MITAMVNIDFSAALDAASVREIFEKSVPNYVGREGLLRKYYIIDPVRKIAGGIYLWDSRESSDKFFTQAWRDGINNRFKSDPVITYFETNIVIDNETDTVSRAAAIAE